MPASAVPGLLLVTPYTASANNGNWRTAVRWAHLLAPEYRVFLRTPDQPVRAGRAEGAIAMVALHARRSRAAIEAWRQRVPRRPLLVALTGTDLYRDVPACDREALASLDDADLLIVLQDDALRHLPAPHRAKARIVYQSAQALVPWPRKDASRLDCVLVAHLREEKDPRTVFAAWRRLPADLPATLTVIGSALDPALGVEAAALAADDARVRWLGPRPHGWTRQAIRRAHLIVVPSRMEGGANVVVEAVTANTAVIATRMSGNLGMLGDDHPGLFPVGDADALAALVARACRDRGFLSQLQEAGERRKPRFAPAAEHAALRDALTAAVALRPVE